MSDGLKVYKTFPNRYTKEIQFHFDSMLLTLPWTTINRMVYSSHQHHENPHQPKSFELRILPQIPQCFIFSLPKFNNSPSPAHSWYIGTSNLLASHPSYLLIFQEQTFTQRKVGWAGWSEKERMMRKCLSRIVVADGWSFFFYVLHCDA